METQKYLPLALVCTFFWGLSYPLVKLGNQFFIPGGKVPELLLFAGMRFLISGGLIVIYGQFRRKKRPGLPALPIGKTLGRVLILSLLLTVFHYTLMYVGLSNCSGSKSSVLKQAGIIVVILFSGVFYSDDKLTPRKLVGCLIGFAGIMICNLPLGSGFLLTGEGFILLASLSSSAGDLYSKHAAVGTDPVFLSGWQQFIGGLILLIAGILSGGRLGAVNLKGAAVLALLVVSSIIAYTLWLCLAKNCEISKLSLLKLTIPIFGIITSSVILGEQLFKWQNWAAVLLVTIGVAIAEQSRTEVKGRCGE